MDVEFKVATDGAEDQQLLRAIQSAEKSGVSHVVLAYVIRPDQEQDGVVVYRRSQFFDSRIDVVAGFANASVDADGFVRQVPLAVRGGEREILPSLGLAMVARYAGYDAANLAEALKKDGEIVLQLPEWDRLRGQWRSQNTPFHFRLDDRWKINFAGGRGSFVALPSDPLAQLAKANVPLASDNPFRGRSCSSARLSKKAAIFSPRPMAS